MVIFLSHYEVVTIIRFYLDELLAYFSYEVVFVAYVILAVIIAEINIGIICIFTKGAKHLSLKKILISE